MKILFWILAVVALALLCLAVYARSIGSDPAEWHVLPDNPDGFDQVGGAVRQIKAEEDTLAQLDRVIRGTPRTTHLAGSVEQGMLTYITRSAGFGFPDYTTVKQEGEQITLYGRLRIGRSDLGVNARRIDGWLALLRQGG